MYLSLSKFYTLSEAQGRLHRGHRNLGTDHDDNMERMVKAHLAAAQCPHV